MINFDRDRFDDMNTSEKISFVNNLVLMNQKLFPKEIQYLVPQNREAYFNNRVKTSEWIEDYEFNCLDEGEKESYIWKKRYLSKNIIKNLSPELQREFIRCAITYGISLDPEEFELLIDDDMRKSYAEDKARYSLDSTFTARELSFLESKPQIQYLNTLKRIGLAPNTDEITVLKPEALRYYKYHFGLNEIRALVRSEIRKVLK
ncbi:MAG: hypothetical protein AABY15_05820 [Nanoarchaeota archaeon]